MECSVCYCETGSACKLACGHTFCNGCIKTWYMKGTGSGCPMCRRPIYFKGFGKVREQWEAEAWETRCAEVIDQALTSAIEEAFEFCTEEGVGRRFRRMIMEGLMDDLCDVEKTARFLMSHDVSPDELEYWLLETDEYFSDRSVGKYKWIDEPEKAFATRYPKIEQGAQAGKRARARVDEWYTISIVVNMV